MARKPKRPPRSPAIRARRPIARRPRGVPRATAGLDLHRCEQFLIHEARLLDEGKFDDWLALFTPDAWYWVPSEPGQPDLPGIFRELMCHPPPQNGGDAVNKQRYCHVWRRDLLQNARIFWRRG